MANRHILRSVVLQALFEWDFRRLSSEEADEALLRNIEEFAPGTSDDTFARTLFRGVLQKQATIDSIMVKAAPEWPLEKISNVDRNVLRIGIYELLFSNRGEVPPKVAINEAIEIAKTFGGENSGRFVNGVLGAIYKELGEPGKDEVGGKKKPIDISKLPVDTLVGSVVYAKKDDGIYLALVHDVFGHWTLSKGHMKEGETEHAAVTRKVTEEMGISVVVEDELGENQYVASDPERGKILKKVKFFLAQAEYAELTLGESGGLDDAQWFKLGDILTLNFYEDILPVITKAINILMGNKSAV